MYNRAISVCGELRHDLVYSDLYDKPETQMHLRRINTSASSELKLLSQLSLIRYATKPEGLVLYLKMSGQRGKILFIV